MPYFLLSFELLGGGKRPGTFAHDQLVWEIAEEALAASKGPGRPLKVRPSLAIFPSKLIARQARCDEAWKKGQIELGFVLQPLFTNSLFFLPPFAPPPPQTAHWRMVHEEVTQSVGNELHLRNWLRGTSSNKEGERRDVAVAEKYVGMPRVSSCSEDFPACSVCMTVRRFLVNLSVLSIRWSLKCSAILARSASPVSF